MLRQFASGPPRLMVLAYLSLFNRLCFTLVIAKIMQNQMVVLVLVISAGYPILGNVIKGFCEINAIKIKLGNRFPNFYVIKGFCEINAIKIREAITFL